MYICFYLYGHIDILNIISKINIYLYTNTKSTETKIIEIDGLEFHTYEFTIYSPEGDIILNQIMYSRLINGLDFGVNINNNNESDKKEMLDVWLNSKFNK